jgi:undecaprenyl-diphosphatase
MSLLEGMFLGLVQGITEFLPISTLGHLVLARDLFSLEPSNALAFQGMLHLSTSLAIIVYFWSDIWTLIQTLLRKLGRLPVNDKDLLLLKALLLGAVPVVVLGILIEPFLRFDSISTGWVAVVLIFASITLMYAEWRYYNRPVHEAVTVKNGFLVGLFQALTLLPGFSRSGATIAGGMLLGMSRYEAARFSFLLALPITLGVGISKLLELITTGGSVDWTPIISGCVASMVASLFVVHLFLLFVRKNTLWPFIWYGVVLSALVGYVSFIS